MEPAFGYSLYEWGRFEVSLSAFNEFIERFGETGESLFRRSKALQKLSRTEEAIQDLTRWASMDPSNPLPHYRLGRLLLRSYIQRENERAKEEANLGIGL